MVSAAAVVGGVLSAAVAATPAARGAQRRDLRTAACTMVEQPMRVALVLFGVIPRSIRWTWPVFERQLLEPLRARGHVVDIYGFNVEVHSPVVDDMPLNQSDVALVPFAALDSWRQEDIDSVIARLCPDGVLKCKSFDDQALPYSRDARVDVKVGRSMSTKGYMNAFRQLHTEMRVARFMASSSHDVAIAAVPDLHLAKKIDAAELHRAASDPAVAFTTTVNDAGGYTNGFYIGQPKTLAKVLDRFENHREVATSMPAEQTSRPTCARLCDARRAADHQRHDLLQDPSDGHAGLAGQDGLPAQPLRPASQREILSEWRAVNERNCAYMRAGCACGNGQVRIGAVRQPSLAIAVEGSPSEFDRGEGDGQLGEERLVLLGALLGGLLWRAGVHQGSGPVGAPGVQDPQELHHLPVPTRLRAVCGHILPRVGAVVRASRTRFAVRAFDRAGGGGV